MKTQANLTFKRFNQIHYNNRINGEKHMIISIDIEKSI